MTILVFNSGILTVATGSWTVTERRDLADSKIEVHVLGSSLQCGKFDLTMAELLEIISDAGKVVDLRDLQTNHKNG